MKAYGRMGIKKTDTNELGHMIKMAAMPIDGRTFKILLPNQLTDDLETWYVASGNQVLSRLFK